MTARRPSFWWLLAIPAACIFILGMSDPALFIWAGVGLLIGYAIAASWMWGVWHDRAVAAESEAMFTKAEVAHLKRMYGDADVAAATAAQLKPTVVDGFGNVRPGTPRPDLSIVPAQRDGSEYEWPALARGIEDDDLTALMRATEEK